MTMDMMLLLGIVTAAFIVFVGGWLSVDLVGLLVLSTLALTGLVTLKEALAGFSSPAVITVWAMFVLSAGLTRTGIANRLGEPLMRFAKSSEAGLIVALMLASAVLSALINTVTVAAILLPTTMELARRSGRPPSRLLLPLALGSLLGGPFTGISTSTNIIATEILKEAGLRPFGIFEFTPITAAIVLTGTAFVVLAGRFLLPSRKAADSAGRSALGSTYQIATHLFTTRIPPGSPLDGRTLAESHIGSALQLTVVALQRKSGLNLAPRPTDLIHAGDLLIVHGQPDHWQRFHGSQHLKIEPSDTKQELVALNTCLAEGVVVEGSPLVGTTLADSDLRQKLQVHVLGLNRGDSGYTQDLRLHRLQVGDRLMLQGGCLAIKEVEGSGYLDQLHMLSLEEVNATTGLRAQLLPVRVPAGSVLTDRTLVESRLGNAFGLTVVGIIRGDELVFMPSPQDKVVAGDLLMLQGSPRDLEVLEGLEDLQLNRLPPSLVAELESQEIAATEVLLSPRTKLAGQTLADLRFRDHYGLNVLAVLRKGRASRSNLQELPLQFGDALLVYGHRRNLQAVAADRDFLVLDKNAARAPLLEKAPIATAIMLAVLVCAISGLVPISIAALTGAALMMATGCLSMEEAYCSIEWKAVFLIASMLPLGSAIQNSGAAQMGAGALISLVGDMGPRWVVAALFLITVIGMQAVPSTALLVLIAPVALNTADTLHISPHLLMMTVALASSAGFASPLSHPAHLLVMGPGGYRFTDYIKVGAPLTLAVMAVAVILLPIFWPPTG